MSEKNIKEIKKEKIKKVLENIKMKDVGTKNNNSSSVDRDYISYPELYLNIKQVPDLKGKDVKDKVCFIIDGSIIGHNIDSNINTKDEKAERRENFVIKVEKIGINKNK